MSFPNVFVECAFANDYDESSNAQTGYTDITPFVKSINGTLRGRQNETGRSEAGTITIDLDNEDGRFTPGRPASPYFPNVKSNRRLRVRGKNMLPANIANTGGKEQDITGFRKGSDPTFSSDIGDPKMGILGFFAVAEGADPNYIYNIYPAGKTGFRRLIEWYGPVELGVRLVHSAYIWRLQGTEATGAMARFEIHYLDADDNYILTTAVAPHSDIAQPIPTSATRTVFSHTPPPTAKNALVTVSYNSPTAAPTDIHIAVSAAQTELPANLSPNPSGYHDILGWEVEGAADQSLTVPTFIGRATLAAGIGTRATAAQTLVANDWLVVQAVVQNNDTEDSNLTPTTTGLTYTTIVDSDVSAAANKTRVITWVAQDTVGGSRTVTITPQSSTKNYSVTATVVRNSSGPGVSYAGSGQSVNIEPSQSHSQFYLAIGDFNAGSTTGNAWSTGTVTSFNSQTAGVLTVYNGRSPDAGNYIPGVTQKFALTAPTITNATIGIVEMLALSTGVENAGPQQDVTNQGVRVDWSTIDLTQDNARAGIEIPHLIPGFTYSLSLEVKKVGTQSYMMSTDDGQTGVTISSTAWTQYNWTFTADQPEQTLSFFPLSNVNYGDQIYFRRLNIQSGQTPPGLTSSTYGPINDATAWEYPKPIFEGWTERWPATVGNASTKVTVTVVDRLKRIGTVELSNVLGEMLYLDNMDLIVPFTDSPTDSQGTVSQIGGWAENGLTQMKFQASKGDIGLANYVLGIDGPTDQTAADFNPISGTLGYSLPVPYSADFTPPSAPKPKPPVSGNTTKPPVYVKKTYTRTYYATWSRTFDSGGAVTFDDTPYTYQGFFSSDRGNNRSLIGFNWTQIKADLAGSTVKSCKLTMKNAHWYFNSGGTAVIGTHIYSGKPGSWSSANVTENRIRSRAWPKGGTATVELGTTIGSQFKAATIKGIALGPGPTTSLDYYGYFNGATQGGRPALTITFVK